MEVPTYAVFFKVHNKQRPVPRPRISPSRYLYVKEWEAAQAAWDQDAELRPSMDHILETLESQNNSQKYIKARVKVVCEQMPACSGYVSRSLDEDFGSQQVTQAIEESLIVAWDPDDQNPQVVYMLNSEQDHTLLALRFNQDSPDYFKDKLLWAAFTAANGTQDNYKTMWTTFAQGLDLLPFRSCSDKGELIPHALGEPLEVGLRLDSDGHPPHLFFCWKVMQYWGRIEERTPARFVLEPIQTGP